MIPSTARQIASDCIYIVTLGVESGKRRVDVWSELSEHAIKYKIKYYFCVSLFGAHY